jgi:thiol-disulfide isomerase/thioredoxin
LRGATVAMQSLKGRPLVLNFWATWCVPCKEEMPDFQRLAVSDLGKSVQIIGIGIDNTKNMRAFAESLGVTYVLLEGGPVGLDLLKSLGNDIGGLPYTVVLDAQGKLIAKHLGRINRDDLATAMQTALRR